MAYTPEPIPTKLIKDMLEQKWDNQSGSVPKPHIMEANEFPENFLEYPLGIQPAQANLIIIRPEIVGEQERLRDLGAQYKDVTFDVSIDLHTMKNRQYLYDMKAEVRRIIHANMHNWNNNYDVCWYRSFADFAQTNKRYWSGTIRAQFQTNKALLDV